MAVFYWQGNFGGNLNDPDNWLDFEGEPMNAVPGINDQVSAAFEVDPPTSGSISVQHFEIGVGLGACSITCSGNFTCTGGDSTGATITAGGNVSIVDNLYSCSITAGGPVSFNQAEGCTISALSISGSAMNNGCVITTTSPAAINAPDTTGGLTATFGGPVRLSQAEGVINITAPKVVIDTIYEFAPVTGHIQGDLYLHNVYINQSAGVGLLTVSGGIRFAWAGNNANLKIGPMYQPDSPLVAPPSAVLAGVSNLGTPGTAISAGDDMIESFATNAPVVLTNALTDVLTIAPNKLADYINLTIKAGGANTGDVIVTVVGLPTADGVEEELYGAGPDAPHPAFVAGEKRSPGIDLNALRRRFASIIVRAKLQNPAGAGTVTVRVAL
ncbi:MAG TPA: hypothetical protein VF624_15060 [Tepidisphaeraceae bacterium]|jgi:hypothetical protein